MIGFGDLPARNFLRKSWFTAGPLPATIFAAAHSEGGAPLAVFAPELTALTAGRKWLSSGHCGNDRAAILTRPAALAHGHRCD